MHESNRFEVELQDARVSGFDVKAIRVTDLGEPGDSAGVAVALELCGDVAPTELQGAVWRVGWDLPERCAGAVRLNDVLRCSEVVRTAFLSKSCSADGTVPVTGQAISTASSVYDVELPAVAWSAQGSTITFTLASQLLGAAAEQVERGAVLAGVRAHTRDGRWLTKLETGEVEVPLPDDGPVGPVVYPGTRQTGPGAEDETGRGPDHHLS